MVDRSGATNDALRRGSGQASRFTLDELIGRLLFVGIPGPTLDAATQRTLEELHVGGVILFRRNVATPAQISALTAALHALPSRPLVAIDHEGGRVQRLGEPFTQFPPAAAIGRARNPDLAHRVGYAMAVELASVGVDLSFAPVLDVNSNPRNPVIGDRAFGPDPELVSELGIALMRGLHGGGVLSCGKHFPGHGDTEKDSHLELPVVPRSRAELEQTELVPFRAAIAAGIPMLMSAHVLYPALDTEHPATLSRAILTDLLRGELHFDGVVASDDLHMHALVNHGSIGEAAIASLRAGADALLACQELERAVEVFAAIQNATVKGPLDTSLISAAAARVERLRARRGNASPVECRLPNERHQTLVEQLRAI
jgi:beta-N-acetylhexosaminidase